jgi:very-short-patch-repair endonuclease
MSRGGVKSAHPIADFRRANAKRLRSNTTSAEQRLWRQLKTLPLFGTHFRRQAPLGPYVADFVCQRAKLVIELDGGNHADPKHQQHDRIRTAWLEAEGYCVLRVWNIDVFQEIASVMDQIYVKLYGSLHAEVSDFTPPRQAPAALADPPPQGEGADDA